MIAGPTASGKSKLAMTLAERLNGAIVNTDSMQVYANLRIMTARPSPEDEAKYPHYLYGHIPGEKAYSVGHWVRDTAAVVGAVWQHGRVAIFVGGTGLYFTGLEGGLSGIPPIADCIRGHWRRALEIRGPEALHRELARRDRQMAERLCAHDGQRVIRALEVFEATGKSLVDWHDRPHDNGPLADARIGRVVLEPERTMLYSRINARFEHMVERGAIDEVAALHVLGLDAGQPVMKAIGVAEIGCYLSGKTTLEEAIAQAKTQTRHYAKRQETWFGQRMKDWPRRDPESFGGDFDRLAQALLDSWGLD